MIGVTSDHRKIDERIGNRGMVFLVKSQYTRLATQLGSHRL